MRFMPNVRSDRCRTVLRHSRWLSLLRALTVQAGNHFSARYYPQAAIILTQVTVYLYLVDVVVPREACTALIRCFLASESDLPKVPRHRHLQPGIGGMVQTLKNSSRKASLLSFRRSSTEGRRVTLPGIPPHLLQEHIRLVLYPQTMRCNRALTSQAQNAILSRGFPLALGA